MTGRVCALLWLFVAVAWGAWTRVETALHDPNFDAERAEGLLRSDPALLYYFTERILEAGGGIPADFRADPRLQHPQGTDIPAEFPVGQEFLVAWAHRWLTPDEPLHRTALWVMALSASLFVLGTFVAVRAVTRSDLWASLAVLLALTTPANYRTIGFLLVGEDLSLPLYALHLGLLARALERRRARDFFVAGLALALALSTWHAMGFVVLLELGVLGLGFLFRGESPFEIPRSPWVLVAPAAAGLLVPVLRASGWLFSPAAVLTLALLVPAWVRRRVALSPGRARVLALCVLAGGLGLVRALGSSSYAHVYQVVVAKLRFLGQLPQDPNEISFDARLLWQGPFDTLAPGDLVRWSGWPLAVLFLGALVVSLRRPERGSFERLVFALALASLPAAWAFGRLSVLIGLFAPSCVTLALAGATRRNRALLALGAGTLLQGATFFAFVRGNWLEWYLPRPARDELASVLEYVRANVPEDEAIACDFVNSTAVLAHTRRPIVLQPKYETDFSRRQAEAFLVTLFHGTSDELARLLRERFDCRYVLFDRYVLWNLSRYTAGLRLDEEEPHPGTAAALFLSQDPAVLEGVPGFELLYRSPHPNRWADFRLYRLR